MHAPSSYAIPMLLYTVPVVRVLARVQFITTVINGPRPTWEQLSLERGKLGMHASHVYAIAVAHVVRISTVLKDFLPSSKTSCLSSFV